MYSVWWASRKDFFVWLHNKKFLQKVPINFSVSKFTSKSFSWRNFLFKQQKSFKFSKLLLFSFNPWKMMLNRLTTATNSFSSSEKLRPKSCMRTVFEIFTQSTHIDKEKILFMYPVAPGGRLRNCRASQTFFPLNCVRRRETQIKCGSGREVSMGCKVYVSICWLTQRRRREKEKCSRGPTQTTSLIDFAILCYFLSLRLRSSRMEFHSLDCVPPRRTCRHEWCFYVEHAKSFWWSNFDRTNWHFSKSN